MADETSTVVTHRPPAQQVLSEMIWYVRLDAGWMAISTAHKHHAAGIYCEEEHTLTC